MSLHDQYHKYSIDQLLDALATNPAVDSASFRYLENILSVRTAEMVNRQLTGTAETVGRSANAIKDSLESSSNFLIAALKMNTETGSKNALEIKEQIAALTASLTAASRDLRTASEQSTGLAGRLNWLTTVVAIAAVLTAGATLYYAVETKRLVDITAQQLRDAAQRYVTNTTKTPSKNP